MLKKIISAITIAAMLISSLCATVQAEEDVKVCLNHEYVSLSVKPKIVNNRLLMPLRSISEAIGCDVDWDSTNKMAVITTTYKIIGMQIGNETISVETRQGFTGNEDNTRSTSEYKTVSPPPMIIDGSAYLPMRALVEALGGTAEWDSETKTADISCHAYSMMLYGYSDEDGVIPKGTLFVTDDGDGHGDITNFDPTYTLPELKYATRLVVYSPISSIGAYNFQNGTNLEEIELQEGKLVQIGEGAFRNCSKLKEIVIPEGVKYIERNAFANCTSLESVRVPSTLEFLGKDAFAGCTSLKNIECTNPDIKAAVKDFVGLT